MADLGAVNRQSAFETHWQYAAKCCALYRKRRRVGFNGIELLLQGHGYVGFAAGPDRTDIDQIISIAGRQKQAGDRAVVEGL